LFTRSTRARVCVYVCVYERAKDREEKGTYLLTRSTCAHVCVCVSERAREREKRTELLN